MLYLICRAHEEERWQLSFVLGKAAGPSFAAGSLEHCQLESCLACQSNGGRRIIEPQGCMIVSFHRLKDYRDKICVHQSQTHLCGFKSEFCKLTLVDLRAPLWRDSLGSLCSLHPKRTSFTYLFLNEAHQADFLNKAVLFLIKAHQQAAASCTHVGAPMSTDRGKSRPKRRNTPNARARGQRRLQLQPVRGRYPVLPPVGQSWPIYPTPAGQNFIIPTTAYPMPLISQMMAYNPQTTMHMNMFQALQPPYVTVPTSMLYCAPMPLCELAEPTNDVIAEVLPDLTEQGSGEEIEQASEDMLPSIQQTILYYDPMVCKSMHISQIYFIFEELFCSWY